MPHDNNTFLRQVMRRYPSDAPLEGVNPAFLRTLLKAFEDKPFCASDFEIFPVELIVEYIQRTHVFYLQAKLPEIEQSIMLLSGLYESHHPILVSLHSFLQEYSHHLEAHITAEETTLLPYIALMGSCLNQQDKISEYIVAREKYSVTRFLESHHDTEDELGNIRSTIRLYQPPATNASLYRVLLAQLQTFEEDLCVHAHIEDLVLIPKALQMEAALDARLGKQAGLN